MRRFALVFALLALSVVLVGACGESPPNLLVRPFDAGADATAEAAPPRDASDPDADPELGGPCTDDPQCDDGIACTFDRCDKARARCRNVPDDTQCDDGTYCNGREVCVRGRGCAAGPVVTCSDGKACTIDRCVEGTKSCEQAPRDLDGDGDPDDHCVASKDCNDTDPTVSSTHAEVCGNKKDDDCDGQIDESGCVTPAGDTCTGAVALAVNATTQVSTVGANKDYATTCSVTVPTAAKDVVGTVVVPAGGNKDLEVWVSSNVEVSVAIQGTCGQASTELSCGAGATNVRTRARDLAPGTYTVVVTSQAEANVDVRVALLAPTQKPTNETCATAAPIALDVPTTIPIVDPAKDVPSACNAATGDLVYSFTLAQAADVKVFATTAVGSGLPVVSLRSSSCASTSDELRCRVGTTLPLFARNLAAGTYYVSVAATAPLDATVQVKTYPPTTAPADQTCAAPPTATVNATMNVSLVDHEDAIKDGCLSGGPNAAYKLTLGAASDVMLVARYPQVEIGAVSLTGPACTPSDRRVCAVGPTPVRASVRNVPAGEYRVVMTDQLGQNATLTALVRPTVAPTIVSGADVCSNFVDIPADGGFFTGDTSSAVGDIDNGCDAPGQTAGGAPDQVLRLVLTQTKRVVFNMDGSTYTTILDVRRGPTCPGQPINGGCYVGFSGARSFLDTTLTAGTYFVIVDGYAMSKGTWNLDVRVVDP